MNEPRYSLDGKTLSMIFYAVTAVLLLVPGARYFCFVPAAILFFAEQENGFLRFHCIQAALVGLIAAVALGLLAVLALIPLLVLSVILHILFWLLILALTVLLALLAIQAYNGNESLLPVVGQVASKLLRKL